ncbi:hypothetical protein [Rickettsia oklahomensis]|uniref:Uncharacterized protein n=1 Tax=Rickettsia oklahomensis TaxID=3141789 RepID=A0AAU7BZ89_9RICK
MLNIDQSNIQITKANELISLEVDDKYIISNLKDITFYNVWVF